jgi:hypothetical protein
LEAREVMTITYHGGALLSSVKVEPYYYGPNWNTDSTLQSRRTALTNYLVYLANGPYTDMLSKAGYNVGRGVCDFWWNTFQAPGSSLSDGTIQNALQGDINAGHLQTPDANRLYTVFVQPGTVVTRGSSDSQHNFDGYHDSFNGSDGHGHSLKIYYAVMPYPGAGTGFFSGNGNAFDSLTDVTSHEVAEAITNPDYRSANYGWNDDHFNGQNTAPAGAEVGDVTENLSPNFVRLNGYAVTKIGDQNDRPMVPAALTVGGQTFSASAGRTFSGTVATGGDTTLLTQGSNLRATIDWGDGTTSAGSVGDDGHGHFPVTGSHTYGRGGTFTVRVSLQDQTNSIGTASSAASETVTAQQGSSSFVVGQFNGSGVWRYSAQSGWQQLTAANASAVAVDDRGDVAAAFAGAGLWRYEDGVGWQQLASPTPSQVSVAGAGIVAAEFSGQGVWRWEDNTGWRQLAGADATSVAVDAAGDVAAAFGGLGVWRYRDAGGWQQLASVSAAAVGIDAYGNVAAAFGGQGVWRYQDASGWAQLTRADAARLGA